MPTEQDFSKNKSKKSIHKDVYFKRFPKAAIKQIKINKHEYWYCIPQIRSFPSENRYQYDFKGHIQRLQEYINNLQYHLNKNMILRHTPQKIGYGLECSSFIVNLKVGVKVVADAVHYLPFIVGEACQEE